MTHYQMYSKGPVAEFMRCLNPAFYPEGMVWEEWRIASLRAAHSMGCTIEELGQKTVTDVLQALHSLRPDDD